MIQFILVWPVLLLAALLYFVPELAPRYTLFGVRTGAGFRRSPQAREAMRGFRIAVVAGAAVAVSLAIVPPSMLVRSLVPPLIVLGSGATGWILEYRRLRSFAAPPASRLASLEISREPDRPPLVLRGWFVPFLILLAAAWYLHAHWAALPGRFPVHWGIDGQPNRWAERTLRGVYGPLIFFGLMNIWFAAAEWMIWNGVRRSGYRATSVEILFAAQLASALIPALISVAPLWKIGPGLQAASTLGLVLAVVIFSIWRAISVSAKPGPEDDNTPESAWHGGIWYFNRDDPALAVPRRDGCGLTLNFARPAAYLLMAGLPALILAGAFWIF
jgi:uncharacterized membrane protein